METKKIPLDTLLLLYYVLIQPRIHYAIIIWSSTCSTYKNRLRTQQSSAIRAIANVRKMQRILPNYFKCGILKLDDLYRFETAKLMYQYTKNDLPKPFFKHMFPQSSHTHSYNTSSVTRKNYNNPPFKTARLQRSFKYQGISIWNNLPLNLKNMSFSIQKPTSKFHDSTILSSM